MQEEHDDGAPTATDKKLRRRKVLRWAGATAAVATAAAGGFALYEAYSRGILVRSGEGPDQQLSDHRVRLPAAVPKLVIARGKSPARNVSAALERFGGMAQLVSAKDVVLVKPNVGFGRRPEQAATTNPQVVAAVVKACREAGAKEVLVVDCPAHPADTAFSRSGIREAAQQAGAKVILPADNEYANVVLPGFGRWPLLRPFLRATKLINLPLAKHHSRTHATVGMKNWIGVLGGMRHRLHDRLDEAIVALAALMRPTLTIVDATRLLMRDGPSGGNLADVKQQDAVAVSQDPVAVDAWAASLLGADVAKLAWLKKAAEKQLGVVDFRSLDPIEIKVG